MIDPAVLAAATPSQLKYLQAVEQHGGVIAAARALGMKNHSVISVAVQRAKAKAAKLASPPQSSHGPKKILVLPDVQAKPGTEFSYLMRIGQYMVEKKPDVVVCIGDFCDYPSLSSFDVGKKAFEGRRYKRDVEASIEAMSAFLTPLVDYNATAKRPYKPRMVLCLGNHEHRAARAVESDPKLEGLISVDDLKYKEFGWEVYPFLETVIIEGVAFSHYFVTGVMGRPCSSAAAQLRVNSMSCFAGHQQGKQIAYGKRADGAILTSIISGSCYEHDEEYLGKQGNNHWRGFWMLHACRNGAFDEMPVSLEFINDRYSHLHVARDFAKEPQEYPEGIR